MEGPGWLLLACMVAYGCAAAVPLAGWWGGGRPARAAGWGAAAGALACPLLIPAGRVGLRAASAFVATDVAFKVVDFLRRHRGAWDGRAAREFGRFLIPFPVLAVVGPDHDRRLARPDPPRPNVGRIAGGAAVFAAGFAVIRALSGTSALRASPWLEHAARVLVFIPTVAALSAALHGAERLAGFDARPILRDPFRSRTVAEFWRRYNTRMHDWYRRNVFEPSGGRHAPARAAVLAFVASALHHEVMFGIATSAFTGYQLAFFLAQAPAVIASGPIERWARRGGSARGLAARAATILFLASTSVLFFDGVARVFPSVLGGGSPLPAIGWWPGR
jgi:hypothetical protein